MKGRKIYQLLILFSEEDREHFSLFMESPYHNVSKTLNLFWTQWRDKVLTSEAGAEMEVEEFVEGTSLKATRFDKLCSQLFTKAKEFLSLRAFEARDVLGELMFSRAVLERDSELETSLYWAKKTEGFLKKLPTSPEKALAQLYHQLQTTEAKIADRKHPPKFAEDFSNMLNNLDFFGQVKELQLTVAAENIRQIFQQKGKAQEEFLPGRIENLLEHTPENLLARIYHYILRLKVGREPEASLKELLAIMETSASSLDLEIQQEAYGFALNYCIRQLNFGKNEFLGPTVDLHIQLLNTGHILEDGKISPQNFKNVVVLACRAGRLEWAEDFIEAWSDKLTDDHDGMAKIYNRAILVYHLGLFGKAIEYLKEVIQRGSHDVFYGMDARMYLWRAYFEYRHRLTPSQVDEMFKLYDAVRLYIDRHKKISASHKVTYRNFVRLFKRFLHLLSDQGLGSSRQDLVDFQVELQGTDKVTNRAWFEEKVEETIASL